MKLRFFRRLRPGLVKHLLYRLFLYGDWRHCSLLIVAVLLPILPATTSSGPSVEDLPAADYTPMPRNDWAVSTPEAQGLDPLLVAGMYYPAAQLKTTYSLLAIKDGYLIAEGYFNGGALSRKDRLQSVTKSYTSALVGIGLDQGYLTSLDQKMVDFLSELADQITDPKKNRITVR
jgi:CubicO group peptidase (beta-lactamase class C family)